MAQNEKAESELSRALRSLLCDIEDMYEGAEPSEDSRHPEEFFGPFSVAKWEDGDLSISWPNLAISMQKAREALDAAENELAPPA
jgi:hypothetical protein